MPRRACGRSTGGGFYRVARNIEGGCHLQVGAGRQELEDAQLGLGQGLDERATGPGDLRLGGADLESRADQLFGEGIRPQLRRMPGQVARHLGCGGHDRVEEALAAGGRPARRTRCQRSSDRRARSRRPPGVSAAPARAAASGHPVQSLQAFACGVVLAGASATLASSRARWAAGSPLASSTGELQVAERQAQQRLELIGPRQQHRAGPGEDQAGRLDGRERVADLPAAGPDPGPVQQRQEFNDGPLALRDR